MIKTDENSNISAEFWLICTEPSEQGSFFQASQNEFKECYAMIKTDENSNISAESWSICTEPSEQGSFFQASQNESKECYAMIKADENLNISVESLPIWHRTFRTGLIFPSWSKWVQGVLCYDQNWQKLKYRSWILIDLHQTFPEGVHQTLVMPNLA